jgi:hypothetical protein
MISLIPESRSQSKDRECLEGESDQRGPNHLAAPKRGGVYRHTRYGHAPKLIAYAHIHNAYN